MSPSAESPADPDPSGEATAMLGQLWRANHEMEMLSKRMIRALGVTGPQRLVLRIVSAKPGVSATGICRAARVHASTLTGILERLVRGGFLERARDDEDGRRARFHLTAEGQRIALREGGTVESAMTRSIGALTREERAVVRQWLDAFADALEVERRELGAVPPPEGTAG